MATENTAARILIVDDEEGIRHGLSRLFEQAGYTAFAAEDEEGALAFAAHNRIDLAILDLRLKHGKTGMDLLELLRSGDPTLPVIMVTGYGSIESAIDAMKHGASDYVLKPIENAALLDAVRRNLELTRLRKDNEFLRKELMDKVYAHNIVTQDSRFLATVGRADRVKDSEASILITGESGTGKEVLARYIHFTGNRRSGPFVSVNCAALSETLLLSELFGHERGAFTGAVERRMGKFEMADGGTLFLDEIGDMALSAQSKLLRVLEENSFERVGGTKRISVDIRVIAATNKKLSELTGSGDFRSDLFYRIAIVELPLPPLRERRADIPLLTDYFLKQFAGKYRKPVEALSVEAAELWRSYDWPGNVRELRNAVNQAVLLSTGKIINAEDIGGIANRRGPFTDHFDPNDFTTLAELDEAVLEHFEGIKIKSTLHKHGGNQTRAATELGITRKTLARKVKKITNK